MAAIFETLAVTGSRKNDGTANASGRAFFYRPGTHTLATIYPDAAQSAPMSNPVTLNAAGKATVYFAGQVDVFIEDAASLPISTLTLSERAERVEVRNAGFTGLLPSGSQGAGGKTDLDTVLSRIFASTGGLDGKYREFTGATSRNIADKFREIWVSVKDYGAVGDGVQDDGTAIQAAANEVTRLGGGVLYFPPGTYKFVVSPTISAPNVCVRGAGREISILKLASVVSSGPVVLATTSVAIVEDLTITCTGNSAATGLTMSGPDTGAVIVSRVSVTSYTIGITTSSTIGAAPLAASNCNVTTITGAATARGIKLTQGHGNVITSCTLNANVGHDVDLSGTVSYSTVGPANRMSADVGLHVDNTSTNVSNIAMIANDMRSSLDGLLITGQDAVTVQTGNGLDGYTANVTSGGTLTPDLTKGRNIVISGTTTGVAYTIAAPTQVPTASSFSVVLIMELKCAAGGAITGWGMAANYHVSATPSTTDATTTTYTFVWDPGASVWREMSRSQTTT